ncbi:LysE family translocator [Methylobacterium sp. ID0610]|uniref:LysE family translocator n=1 Tax=Methylobacterium carpenticola TaxID=3344827 RepID=UPI0036A53A37
MPSVAFLITVLVLELTPGPNMTTLAVLALARGRRAGLAMVLGVALGLAVQALAAGLGAGFAVARYPALFGLLRWAGVLVLVGLSVEIWIGRDEGPAAAAGDSGDGLLLRGFLLNLLNPKSFLFFLAALPRFVRPEGPSVEMQMITLGAVYVLIATVIHAGIVLLAARLRPSLRDSRTATRLRKVSAVLLVLVAVWLAVETGR